MEIRTPEQVQEAIKQLRNVQACEKHLRISEGLKEYSALGGRYSDHGQKSAILVLV